MSARDDYPNIQSRLDAGIIGHPFDDQLRRLMAEVDALRQRVEDLREELGDYGPGELTPISGSFSLSIEHDDPYEVGQTLTIERDEGVGEYLIVERRPTFSGGWDYDLRAHVCEDTP